MAHQAHIVSQKERKGSGTFIAPIVSNSTTNRSDVDHTVTCKYTTSAFPSYKHSLEGDTAANRAWVLGPSLCKVVLYVQIVTLASTTFILTAMSVDRYLAICHPLQRTCKPKAMIAVSWLAALVFATPQLFIFKQVSSLYIYRVAQKVSHLPIYL